jgi:hypothetical protein
LSLGSGELFEKLLLAPKLAQQLLQPFGQGLHCGSGQSSAKPVADALQSVLVFVFVVVHGVYHPYCANARIAPPFRK